MGVPVVSQTITYTDPKTGETKKYRTTNTEVARQVEDIERSGYVVDSIESASTGHKKQYSYTYNKSSGGGVQYGGKPVDDSGSKDEVKQEINEDFLNRYQGTYVTVTYRDEYGEVKRVTTQDVRGTVEDIRSRGGSVYGEVAYVEVDNPNPDKPGSIVYDNYREVYSSDPIIVRDRQRYEETGNIPQWFREEVRVPEQVRAVGASDEYINQMYRVRIGQVSAEDANAYFSSVVMPEKIKSLPDTADVGGEIWYYKQFGVFEGGLSWNEYKRNNPSAKIEMVNGEVQVKVKSAEQVVYDNEREDIRSRWSGERGLKDQVLEFGRFWFSGFTPENLLYHKTIGGAISDNPDKILDDYTSSIIRTDKALKDAGWLGVFGRSYEPGGFGFIGTTTAVFIGGFQLVGAAGSGAAGTTTGKVLSGFASKAPWVTGGIMSGLTGAEIGYTFAARGKDAGIEKSFERASQFGLALGMGYMSSRGPMSVFPKPKYEVVVAPDSGVVAAKKYLFSVGNRPVGYYGRAVGVKTGLEPDFTKYNGIGIPQRTGVVYTYNKNFNPVVKAGVEPIPHSMAMVPYSPQSLTIFKPSFNIFFKDVISTGVVPGDPESFVFGKMNIPKFNRIVESGFVVKDKGTPVELRKPIGFNKVIEGKSGIDFISHKGYPLGEKESVDWMDKGIPK